MKKLLLIIILAVVVGGSAFYGGIKYAENKKTELQDLSSEQRAKMRQWSDSKANGFKDKQVDKTMGVKPIKGEIIAKDDKSVTIKLQDGGSKIIFFSDSTKITKSLSGAIDNLADGEQIAVSGVANQNGSITAQFIRIELF